MAARKSAAHCSSAACPQSLVSTSVSSGQNCWCTVSGCGQVWRMCSGVCCPFCSDHMFISSVSVLCWYWYPVLFDRSYSMCGQWRLKKSSVTHASFVENATSTLKVLDSIWKLIQVCQCFWERDSETESERERVRDRQAGRQQAGRQAGRQEGRQAAGSRQAGRQAETDRESEREREVVHI